MYIKFIACGAAGGKALISAIDSGVCKKEDCLITNTTSKDVVDEYKDIFLRIGDSLKGCGKERTLAKNITMQALKNNELPIDDFVTNGDPDMIVLVTSTSGGSGSGSSTILAKYIKNVLGVNVHIFGFTGFGMDGREMQNTIEFFQDIEEDFGIECISNEKFISNEFSITDMERAADYEFCDRMRVLQGLDIRDSVQNIDDTDLYKLSTTTGFMNIEYIELPDKIKNATAFVSCLTEGLDNSKSLETSIGCHRLGIIINCREEDLQYIDVHGGKIKDRYGVPYESFLHIQHESDLGNFIAIIVGGMKLPTEEVKAVYETYKVLSQQVNKEKDNFFDDIGNLRGDQEDSMFNLQKNKKKMSKDDFFK